MYSKSSSYLAIATIAVALEALFSFALVRSTSSISSISSFMSMINGTTPGSASGPNLGMINGTTPSNTIAGIAH